MTDTLHAAAALRERMAAVRLYVVTESAHSPERTLEVVRAACDGGAGAVQLRRKGDEALATLRLAERCRAVTAAAGVLLVVNDRLDVAMACDADGVHLGQDDLDVATARRLWPGRLVGRSTHSADQVRAALADGADNLGVGPVFATPTKPGRPPVGLGLVTSAARLASVPWVAIGGVDEHNVHDVLEAGARAVAVVRAVSGAADCAAAARRLRRAVDEFVTPPATTAGSRA